MGTTGRFGGSGGLTSRGGHTCKSHINLYHNLMEFWNSWDLWISFSGNFNLNTECKENSRHSIWGLLIATRSN